MTTLAVRYAQALRQSLPGGLPAKQVLENFVGVVRRHRREALLPAILAAYRQLEDRDAGRVPVQVVTARPLSAPQRQKLAARIAAVVPGAQEVVLDEQVEPALRAGFRAEFAGMVWDASVQGRLAQLQGALRGALLKQNQV